MAELGQAMNEAPRTIALIGLGTIGLSFAALHLKFTNANVRLFDVRSDLKEHVASLLPVYLGRQQDDLAHIEGLKASGRITLCSSLEDACKGAAIIQEQGPEKIEFKKETWARAVKSAPKEANLWSSTSGILASRQIEELGDEDKRRLVIVHPYNPPHLTPLIEIVPSPYSDPSRVKFARDYFANLNAGYSPVVINKEITGFVGNRLAFALFREACHLVANDILSVKDLDAIMEASHGPRWAVAGPFKLWNLGGGAGGIGSFLSNLGTTIEELWEDAGTITLKKSNMEPNTEKYTTEDAYRGWIDKVIRQTDEAYGRPTALSFAERDSTLSRVIQARSEK